MALNFLNPFHDEIGRKKLNKKNLKIRRTTSRCELLGRGSPLSLIVSSVFNTRPQNVNSTF